MTDDTNAIPGSRLPIFVEKGSGTVRESTSLIHKLTGRQTGGGYYAFETTFGPGAGNRLHVHSREDEFGYVLEGALEVRLADRTALLEAGGLAHLPKGIPHALRNPLETPSHYLFIAIPAGLDQWFDALDEARREGTLDESRYQQLSLEYGIRWLE